MSTPSLTGSRRHTTLALTVMLLASTSPVWAQTAAPAATPSPSGAFEFEANGDVTLGMSIRTDGRDPLLLQAPNAARQGVTESNPAITGAKSYDDGDLNCKRGKAVSTVANALIDKAN